MPKLIGSPSRPEKEHSVQLEAFKLFLDKCPQYKNGKDDIKLVLAGSVRNEGDEQRVEDLRSLARKLDIQVTLLLAFEPRTR